MHFIGTVRIGRSGCVPDRRKKYTQSEVKAKADIQLGEWLSFRIRIMKTNIILDSIPRQVIGLILAVCFLMNSYGTYIVIYESESNLVFTNRFEDRHDVGRQAFCFIVIRGTSNVFA